MKKSLSNNFRLRILLFLYIIMAFIIQENVVIGHASDYNYEETQITDIDYMAEPFDAVNLSYILKCNEMISYVPENIRESFLDNGWHVYVTSEDLTSKYFSGVYENVRGATFFNENIIKIEANDDAIQYVTLHEFGHYLDYICGFPSSSPEFQEIYKNEADLLISNTISFNMIHNERELFAETFYYICIDPSRCTPEAKEFVERYIDSV